MTEPSRAPRSVQEPGWPRPPRPLGIVLYVVGLTIVFGLLTTIATDGQARSVSYTEFKQLVRAGRVAAVTINQDRIRGTLKEADHRFVAIRIEDPGLVAELEQHQVAATGEITSNWWSSLMWLAPLVLLIVFWNFTLSRAGQAQGATAFGRSRAKIYAEADVKVTFADVAGIDEATEELREIVDFLQKPKTYTDLGGRIPKGVLLVGPPGTGRRCWRVLSPASSAVLHDAPSMPQSRCACGIVSRRPGISRYSARILVSSANGIRTSQCERRYF